MINESDRQIRIVKVWKGANHQKYINLVYMVSLSASPNITLFISIHFGDLPVTDYCPNSDQSY